MKQISVLYGLGFVTPEGSDCERAVWASKSCRWFQTVRDLMLAGFAVLLSASLAPATDYKVEFHRQPIAQSAQYEVEVHVAEVTKAPAKNPLKYAVMLSAGRRQALASGVNTAAGIVTCAHVVEGHTEFNAVCDGETAVANVVSVDKQNDLALLSVSWKTRREEAEIATEHPSAGEQLTSVGRQKDGTLSVETHVYKSTVRNEYQYTNPPQEGRSGSGIFNARGKLVGICLGKIVDVEPYVGRSAVVTDIARITKAIRQPPAKATASVPGLHSHQCPKCGHTWSHGSDSFGNREDHTCPACGKAVVWEVSASKPVIVSGPAASNCPGGMCPTQQRFSLRFRR